MGANVNGKGKNNTRPFIHQIRIQGPQGEVVRVWATFDEGALMEAMSTETFEKAKHRMGALAPSSLLLRMANGTIVRSLGRWEGKIEVEDICVQGSFEVFDSLGAWDFLLGKRMKNAFKAIHNYEVDEVTIKGEDKQVVLKNQVHIMERWRQSGRQRPTTIGIITEEERTEDDEYKAAEVEVETLQNNTNLFTRQTEPFKPERVAEILRLVTIGEDLDEDQRDKVRQLISSFADVFALSVHEVRQVEGAVHQIDIPAG